MAPENVSPNRIQDIMYGFWASKSLFAGVELGIFDELSKTPGGAEVLSVRLQTDPSALERLLNALTALGLLIKTKGIFSLAPESKAYLVKGKPTYIGGQAEHLSRLHWRLWQYLPDAIREGTPRIMQALGPGFEAFAAVFQLPQEVRAFIQGMYSLSSSSAEEIVGAIDLSRHQCLMDVGGGSGALSIAAVHKYTQLKAILFELPQVCSVAQEHIDQNQLEERIKVLPGDFFDRTTMSTEADVIALGGVLHDWSPTQAKSILRNCYEVLKPEGTLLVCEKLLEEDKTAPVFTTLMNLHGLISSAGEERTALEYSSWLRDIGLKSVRVQRLNGNRDLIVGYKK